MIWPGYSIDSSALRQYPEITLVPGVELSTDIPGNEIHVLGYWVDERDQHFQSELLRFREGRIGRGREMVDKLGILGIHISFERVREIAGEASIGRPHVAQALVESGYIASTDEAFERYIGRNGPAYAEREKMTPAEAVQLIRSAGGLAVVAHPTYIDDMERVIGELVPAGLTGMEVYYRRYTPETVESLRQAAERLGIFPLGGSDYHAMERESETEPGDIPLPDHIVDTFMELGRGRPGFAGVGC
ncbi:MAG: PHP domain-containing protein [Chloroflexi bacterium]|nr:PHP domain-containing protein [Chloroflexota bacterium]